MKIDFGKVEKYNVERGFGFVERNLNKKKDSKAFFHISTVKEYDQKLLLRLKSGKINDIAFWYEYESTQKGEQVKKILNLDDLDSYTKAELSQLLEKNWLDTAYKASTWLETVSLAIFDKEKINKLKEQREFLIQKQEQERLELENAKRLELARQQAIREQEMARLYSQIEEENEFQQLVDEMSALNFANSSQVSDYIRRNQLGNKYKHISGVLEMSKDGNTWNFNGGFLPKIYAKLCSELNLTNQGTNARAGRFTSFNDLNNR